MSFLGAVTRQLLEKLAEIPVDIEERIKNSTGFPDNSEMTRILFSALSNFPKVFLIIDGIDELQIADQQAIWSISKKLEQFKDAEIKLFISSRPNTLTTTFLRGFRVDLSTANISSDIGCFFRARVRSCLDSGELRIRNPALEEEIVRALLEGAKGLYACWISH